MLPLRKNLQRSWTHNMKTRNTETSGSSQILQIPKLIQNDIRERGFHLYKWIDPEEVKLSIERDFLKILKYIAIPLWVLAIIAWLLTVIWFFVVIFFGVFFMMLYLLFLSLKRSRLLTKSSFVVLTDSSISLWGKIVPLSEVGKLQNNIKKVSHTFEEKLFEESWLKNSKWYLMKDLMEQLFWGYRLVLDNRMMRSKDAEKWIIIIILLYTAYIVLMAIVYFFGVLFLWIFWKIIVYANTKYLLWKWEKVIHINTLFWEIDILSEDLREEKYHLKNALSDAYQNDWKDGLLLKINKNIQVIGRVSEEILIKLGLLKQNIESSEYKEMFSFEVFHRWTKKQIEDPLKDILKLLEKNRDILENKAKEIEVQIQESSKIEYKENLKLQLKRVEIQKKEILRYIPVLEVSLEKLRS